MKHLWSRRNGETDEQWAAFQRFLEGVPKTVVADRSGMSRVTITRWSKQNHWNQRLEAYKRYEIARENEVAERAADKALEIFDKRGKNPIITVLEGEMEAYEELLKAARSILKLVNDASASLTPSEIRILELRREQAAVLLRWWASRGEESEQDEPDYSGLTDEEIEQLEEIQRKVG